MYQCVTVYWILTFIIHVALSITITVVFYQKDEMIYFWVSAGIFVVYYIITFVIMSVGWLLATYYDDYQNPLWSYCLPCMILCSIYIDDDCIDETMTDSGLGAIFWWFTCLLSLIPMIIWTSFLPFYILILMITVASDNDQHKPGIFAIGCYLFPHTILQIVALLMMDNKEYIMNLLLITSILISISWYLSKIYLVCIGPNKYHHNHTQGLSQIVKQFQFYATVIDIILIFLTIMIYSYTDNMNKYYIFNVILIIFGSIAVPSSLPILCWTYHKSSRMYEWNFQYVLSSYLYV